MATNNVIYFPALHPEVTEEAGTRGGAHTGMDLAAKLNDPVLAAFDGEVVFVGGDGASGRLWIGYWLYPNGEGKTVDIRRADGLISRVGHLNGYAVKQGQKVKAGQVIGYAGTTGYSTGVHIHWELRWDRTWGGGNWINPRRFNLQIFGKDIMTPEQEKKLDRVIADIDWLKARIGGSRDSTTVTQRLAGLDWIKDRIGGGSKSKTLTHMSEWIMGRVGGTHQGDTITKKLDNLTPADSED